MCTEIVTAGPADLERVHSLFVAYRRFYRLPQGDETSSLRFIADRLTRLDSIILLAARGRRDACGFLQIYPTLSSLRLGATWILNDLYVRPADRGHGIGRTLVEAAARLARARDALAMSLETAHDNAIARSLYESIGFRESVGFVRYNLEVPADPAGLPSAHVTGVVR